MITILRQLLGFESQLCRPASDVQRRVATLFLGPGLMLLQTKVNLASSTIPPASLGRNPGATFSPDYCYGTVAEPTSFFRAILLSFSQFILHRLDVVSRSLQGGSQGSQALTKASIGGIVPVNHRDPRLETLTGKGGADSRFKASVVDAPSSMFSRRDVDDRFAAKRSCQTCGRPQATL